MNDQCASRVPALAPPFRSLSELRSPSACAPGPREPVEEEIRFAVLPAMRRKRRLCQKAEAPGSLVPVARAPQRLSEPLRRHLSDLLLTERRQCVQHALSPLYKGYKQQKC